MVHVQKTICAYRESALLAGGAPLFIGERAFEKLSKRKTKVASYYFDLNLVGDYWGWFNKRFYHHTGMTSNWCAHKVYADVP